MKGYLTLINLDPAKINIRYNIRFMTFLLYKTAVDSINGIKENFFFNLSLRLKNLKIDQGNKSYLKM